MQSGVLYLKQRIWFGYMETVWGKTKKVLFFLFYFFPILFHFLFIWFCTFQHFHLWCNKSFFFFFAIKFFFPILCTYILVLLTRKLQSTLIIKNKNYPLIHQQYYKYNQFYSSFSFFFLQFIVIATLILNKKNWW